MRLLKDTVSSAYCGLYASDWKERWSWMMCR